MAFDAVTRTRIELGATRPQLAGERIEDGRTEFIAAMQLLDSTNDRDLHVRVGKVVSEIDDPRALLSERHGA